MYSTCEQFSDSLLAAIEEEVRETFPYEFAAFILKDGTLVVLENTTKEDQTTTFTFQLETYVRYKDQLAYLIHSHTTQRVIHICTPSLADVDLQISLGIRMLIAGFDGIRYTPPVEFPAVPSPIYLNRPYIYGACDCGILLRDYYHFEFNIPIHLNIYHSIVTRKEWTKSIESTFKLNPLFYELPSNTPLQRGDLLLTNIAGGVNNHVVLYIGDNMVLNQGVISLEEPLNLWINKTSKVFRHPEVIV